VVKLARQSGFWLEQLAFEEQPRPQLTGNPSQQTVSPFVRFRQPLSPHTSGQLAQAPFLLQLGVLPPQVPQLSVPPHPSGAVPQVRPSSAQVFGMQTHCSFWQISCPVQARQLWPGRPQFWFVFPGSQVPGLPSPLEQQPFGQLCAVQRQDLPSALQTVLGGQVSSH
jgi:hypothetical protein